MKIKSKGIKLFSAVLSTAALLIITALCASVSAAEGGVPINSTTFPDERFREYVLQNADSNNDGYLSEKELKRKIIIQLPAFAESAKGIEYFTELKTLVCEGTNLTSLDVSRNTKLERLRCGGNELTDLDVSKNTALKLLYCERNKLTSLNVSNNKALTDLWCSSNQLTFLDVNSNSSLAALKCNGNKLSALDVRYTAMQTLSCEYNELTSLYVNGCSELKVLRCSVNRLPALNIRDCPLLEELRCFNNEITELDVSVNTALRTLYCDCNMLTSIDAGMCSQLTKYDLGVSRCEYSVVCPSGKLDLSKLPGHFDISKASNWKGGTVNGKILTFNNGSGTVTYDYDCGMGYIEKFKIINIPSASTGGDLNGDKKTTVSDIIVLKRVIAAGDPSKVSGCVVSAADVNKDNKYTVADIIALKKLIAGANT